MRTCCLLVLPYMVVCWGYFRKHSICHSILFLNLLLCLHQVLLVQVFYFKWILFWKMFMTCTEKPLLFHEFLSNETNSCWFEIECFDVDRLLEEKSRFDISIGNQMSAFRFVFLFEITTDSPWLWVLVYMSFLFHFYTTYHRLWSHLHQSRQERDQMVVILPNISVTKLALISILIDFQFILLYAHSPWS